MRLFLLLMLSMSSTAHSDFWPAKTPGHIETCRDAIARGLPVSDQPPLPRVFGLLSWNLHKGLDQGWENDLQWLIESTHLLFLQEAQPGARLTPLMEALPFQYFAPGFSLAGKTTGVMSASTSPSPLHCGLSNVEPWIGTPKATSVTLHAVGRQGTALLAINLHGINLSIGTRVFNQQMLALEQLIEIHNGPVILGGDINAWSHKRLAILDTVGVRHGLRRIGFQPDLRTRIVGLAMDYIYVRGLDTVLAESLPVTSSDHNPLLLKLALPAAD
ncbi:MAG: endonuclease/exonuclease/phosphatase family protein [Chromatocurvus sp.]